MWAKYSDQYEVSSDGHIRTYSVGLRSAKGTNNSRCKLSEDDVHYIKKHYIPYPSEYNAKS